MISPRIGLALFLLMFMTGCTEEPKPVMLQDHSEALLVSHNQHRALAGKPLLALNDKLTIAAQKHAEWMSKHRLSHTGASWSQPWDRAEAEGYRYSQCGENIAYGQETVDEVMKGWMKSRGHKANILGKYQEVGFGVVMDDDGTIWWCALFATPE